jgi:transposase-like protein
MLLVCSAVGIWAAGIEGAKFWLQVVMELKIVGRRRSLSPVSMACKASRKRLNQMAAGFARQMSFMITTVR